MDIKGIKLVFPIFGVGDFAFLGRRYATALIDRGIPITIEALGSSDNRMYASVSQELVARLNSGIDYNVVICFADSFTCSKVLKKENSSYCKLAFINDESFTAHRPWTLLLDTYVSGVITPQERSDLQLRKVKSVFPYPVDQEEFLLAGGSPQLVTDRLIEPKPDYIFYTNFLLYDDAVNLEDLLRAYYLAFTRESNTCLVVSCNLTNNKKADVTYLNSIVAKVAAELNRPSPPNILFMFDLSSSQRWMLHSIGQCYVNSSRVNTFSLDSVVASLKGSAYVTHALDGQAGYFASSESVVIFEHCLEKAVEGEVKLLNENSTVVRPHVESLTQALKTAHQGSKGKDRTASDIPEDVNVKTVTSRLLELIHNV